MHRYCVRLALLAMFSTLAIALTGCGANHIWQAAESGQYHEVERMLNDNPNWVNAKDGSGRTPLMNAVRGEHERIVKLLLDRGADPRVTGASGVNALHEARAGSNSTITRMIEAKIEELNAKERKGTPVTPSTPGIPGPPPPPPPPPAP